MKRDGAGREETKSPTARISARHVEQFGNLTHTARIHDTSIIQGGARFGHIQRFDPSKGCDTTPISHGLGAPWAGMLTTVRRLVVQQMRKLTDV